MRTKHISTEMIDNAALSVFVKNGVNGARVRDIAVMAGVSEGSLYRFYQSKEALACSVYRKNAEEISKDMQDIHQDAGDFSTSLSYLVIYFCRLFDSNLDLFSYIFFSQPSTLAHLDVADCMPQQALTKILAESLHRVGSSQNPVILSAHIFGVVTQTARAVAENRLPGQLIDYADDIIYAVSKLMRSDG